MRTTITIAEQLLEDLKRKAAEEGTTVSRLIEDSVRLSKDLRMQSEKGPAFELVTFGKDGHFTLFDIDRVSALLEQDDVESHGRRR